MTYDRRPFVIGVALAILAGAILAVQSLANGELAAVTGDALLAGAQSFLVSAIVLLIVVLFKPSSRRALVDMFRHFTEDRIYLFFVLAGLFGAGFIAIQSASVAVLGVAVFSVAMISGQNIGGLIIDRFGIGGGGIQPLNGGRLLAGVIGIFAALIAAWPALGSASVSIALLLLVVLGGMSGSMQLAFTGRISVLTRDPLVGAWAAFVTGAIVLSLIVIVRGFSGSPSFGDLLSVADESPFLVVGGLGGAGLMLCAAIAIPRTGVLVFGMAIVIGQLAIALVLDTLTGRIGGLVFVAIACVLTALSVVVASRASGLKRRP